jgi:hypothetical protein
MAVGPFRMKDCTLGLMVNRVNDCMVIQDEKLYIGVNG